VRRYQTVCRRARGNEYTTHTSNEKKKVARHTRLKRTLTTVEHTDLLGARNIFISKRGNSLPESDPSHTHTHREIFINTRHNNALERKKHGDIALITHHTKRKLAHRYLQETGHRQNSQNSERGEKRSSKILNPDISLFQSFSCHEKRERESYFVNICCDY